MKKTQIGFFLLGLLLLSLNGVQAQSVGDQLIAGDNLFWTLPATECDGDNFCEVRISPQGTIYGWDNIYRKLYVSPANQDHYQRYDLGDYAEYLGQEQISSLLMQRDMSSFSRVSVPFPII